MKESRTFSIENKVFKKQDLINISSMFFKEFESSKQNNNRCSINFKVICSDGTSYESESFEMFESGSIIDIKECRLVEFTLHNYTLNRFIDFTITKNGSYVDKFFITGEDSNWVNGVFNKGREIIDSVEPQNLILEKYKYLIINVGAIGIGILLMQVVALLFLNNVEPIDNPPQFIKSIKQLSESSIVFSIIFELFILWFIGIWYAIDIFGWVKKLWPIIEFDFGPEYKKVEKKRRFRLGLLFTIFIGPILVSSIYDLIKYFTK